MVLLRTMKMDEWLDRTGYSQRNLYEITEVTLLRKAQRGLLSMDVGGAKKGVVTYGQYMPGLPDMFMIPNYGKGGLNLPLLDPETTYPKEAFLTQLCLQALGEGRRIGVFVTYMREGLMERLQQILLRRCVESHLIQMEQSPCQRREGLNRAFSKGINVVIGHNRYFEANSRGELLTVDQDGRGYEFDLAIYYQPELMHRESLIRRDGTTGEVIALAYEDTVQMKIFDLLGSVGVEIERIPVGSGGGVPWL